MTIQAVITGIGAISPAGIGVENLWRAARDGVAFGGPIAEFDTGRNASHIAAHVPGFDPVALGLSPGDVERTDRVVQFSVLTSRMAVRDAGLEFRDPTRAGVVMGTAVGGVGFMERAFNRCSVREGASKPAMVAIRDAEIGPHVYGGFLAHSVSTEVARDLGVCGVCYTISTGCTAGLDAIGTAVDLIAGGHADIIITGGADAPITPIVLTAFDNISCLTRRNDHPSCASRPFDRDRDGFLLAEGCGVLILESPAHAFQRSAKIYGAVIGFASLSNAYHMTSLPSDGSALASTLSAALCNAQIRACDVDYINAHGSSTKQNDRNETSAFKRTFGEAAKRIPISSTKSVIGHALGAASALETIVCVRAMQEGVVPPTANYETPDPECDLDYVPNMGRQRKINLVECNASGFSGIHSSLLLSRNCQ